MTVPHKDWLERLLADEKIQSQIAEKGGTSALETLSRLTRTVATKTAAPTDAVSSNELATLSPTRVRAAISYTFALADLDKNEADRRWLLNRTEIVTFGGRRALLLNRETRATVLNDPKAMALVSPQLDTLREGDQRILDNPMSSHEVLAGAYLRLLLDASTPIDLPSLATSHRRALTDARRALVGIEAVEARPPSLADCNRVTELAELLDPVGLMIGLENAHTGRGSDRFAGRADELRQLRSLVDELGSRSALEAISRGATRFAESIQSAFGTVKPRLMTISSRGGLGKSTLMAKFVFDHALNPEAPFPFAYLDFDRSSLQPRDPRQLLLRAGAQVALQFPAHEPDISALQTEIRHNMAGRSNLTFSNSCATFRELIRAVLNDCSAGTFLLSLDTMELVQADPQAMGGVLNLLDTLCDEPFPELCVVASGRADMPELTQSLADTYKIQSLTLKALSVADARELVDKLGRVLMADQWRPIWAKEVAGSATHPDTRREPLTLRLAVELIRDTAPEERDTLIADLRTRGEDTDERFVEALYKRRILDHVGDKKARKLAWPGLVVRRLTAGLAKNVLAPLCGLTALEAVNAYEMLAKEVWIVQREGDSLQHRRDLRARTLPLMRRHDKEKFDAIVAAMIDHFSGAAQNDTRTAVEHLYYRLLRGNEADLTSDPPAPDLLYRLNDARDDFAKGTLSWCLLEAEFAQKPLTLKHLKKLPDDVLWRHLGLVGSGLRGLDDKRIETRVRYLVERPPPNLSGDNEAAVAARIAWQGQQIKSGHWLRLNWPDLVLPTHPGDLAVFSYYIVRVGVEPADFWNNAAKEISVRIEEKRGRPNWQTMAHLLASTRLTDHQLLFEQIDSHIANALVQQSATRRGHEIALRTILQFGEKSFPLALTKWAVYERDRIRDGISFAEFAILAVILGKNGKNLAGHRSKYLYEMFENAFDFDSAIRNCDLEDLTRFLLTNKEVIAYSADILKKIESQGDDPMVVYAAKLYSLVRAPDWVVPFAYLFDQERRTIERAVRERTFPGDRYDPDRDGFLQTFGRAITSQLGPHDMIQLFNWGDCAGDFDGIATDLNEAMPVTKYDKDRQALLSARKRWREITKSQVMGSTVWTNITKN